MEYSGNDDLIGEGVYDYVNNKIFYWKNVDFSSHMLHPFMYNLKLWNKLNNIIINGYKDYVNDDLIEYLSSKTKFDQMFGKFGESKNFWKYNVMDLTGYTTRYEAAIKDEHKDDINKTISELTGYDGLFYPGAARDFVDLMDGDGKNFALLNEFFTGEVNVYGESVSDPWLVGPNGTLLKLENAQSFVAGRDDFLAAIYSVYWQQPTTTLLVRSEVDSQGRALYKKASEGHSFYTKWYSHLNYTRSEYQKIAMQLWYWRSRILELIRTEYPISKYCLDIRGNSMILVNTFADGVEKSNPYLIDLQIAQNDVRTNRTGNKNVDVHFCDNSLVMPSELWIRWKSNPIAMPAFDVDYDKEIGDQWFDFYYRNGQRVEFGQLTHTNNDCNENFKLVILKWRDAYGDMVPGNKLPVFFDMEQSANVLALSSWYRVQDVDEDGIVQLDEWSNPKVATCCAINPLHIISIERVGTNPSEYNLEQYYSSEIFNNQQFLLNWAFNSYQYCPARGSLLVPMYRLDCSDDGDQKIELRMYLISAQMLKSDNFSTNPNIVQLNADIDLNKKVDFGSEHVKYLFDNPVKVCRNTNVAFSVCDINGQDKVKCAFLGNYVDGNSTTQFKVSSCGAKTRYGFDSQSEVDLALTKGKYYDGRAYVESRDGEEPPIESLRYIDEKIAHRDFNSYDSMDKYVFVIDFDSPLDSQRMFSLTGSTNIRTHVYNVLGDSGYIPHFAYQSLVNYDSSDKDCGTAYTWKNKYLASKDHMQFELLGLDDKGISDVYDTMQRMLVDDLSDNCKTILCPAKMMGEIYRIWCENATKKHHEYDPCGSYFANEYMEYPNPKIEFVDVNEDNERVELESVAWNVWEEDEDGNVKVDDLFELDIPRADQQIALDETLTDEEKEQRRLDAFKALLDDYYVSVARTENGDILNEKRYILPPTPLSQFILGVEGDGSKMKCKLGRYQSAMVQDGHFVSTQVMIVGTPNPFNYDNDGERIFSRAEELQYGNSVPGLGWIELGIDIESRQNVSAFVYDIHGNVMLDEFGNPMTRMTNRKWLKPTVVFHRPTFEGDMTLSDRISRNTLEIQPGQVTVMFSHKNLDNIAKYHMLNRYSNLYFSGSLQKDGKNKFKFSDFKYSKTLMLKEVAPDKWESIHDEGQVPELTFTIEDVKSASDEGDDAPPYYLGLDGKPMWFLEQDELLPSGCFAEFYYGDKHYFDEIKDIYTYDPKVCGEDEEPLIEYPEIKTLICSNNMDDPLICMYRKRVQDVLCSHQLVETMCGCMNGDRARNSLQIQPSVENNGVICGDLTEGAIGRHAGESSIVCQNGVVESIVCGMLADLPIVSEQTFNVNTPIVCMEHEPFPVVWNGGISWPDSTSIVCNDPVKFHQGRIFNDQSYPKPMAGKFRWAHKVLSKPEKYLDYFYVDIGALAFKVNEESTTLFDELSLVPPFYVDEVTKNKVKDLNDIQILRPYSTFVHQSENPKALQDCSSFNPLVVDVSLINGCEQVELEYDSIGKITVPRVVVVEKYRTIPNSDWPIVSQLPQNVVCNLSESEYQSMLEVICQDKNTISGGAICAIDDPSLPTLCWKNGYQELFKSNKLVVCGEMNTPIMCGESFGFVYTDAVGPIICHGQNGGNYIFEREQSMVKLDNFDEKTRLKLQLEDDEVADLLKIYTNYVRVDDGHGDFHYDLYFNVQNLFNSPFEYISSVTGQPNVLILPDSYLYLSGDKYTDGKVDEDKVKMIQEGGTLTIYGQVKAYSDDKLSDVTTIKLFSYKVYNISDDKPKFLIDKVFDITKTPLRQTIQNVVELQFSDVLWTVDENKFKFEFGSTDFNGWTTVCDTNPEQTSTIVCSSDPEYLDIVCNAKDGDFDRFKELDEDIYIVQPVKVKYNWDENDDYRIKEISFDIVNDVIDFENTPQLMGYETHDRTLRNGDDRMKPYYDRWSDKYMTLETNPETGTPRITLKYDKDCGFNFETIYLRWKLPRGCKVMDTIDRLGGFVFGSTAQNLVAVCNNNSTISEFNVKTGHVTARVKGPGSMYLGIEHSSTKRMNGYVITGLADSIRHALTHGASNPTLDNAITEMDLKNNAQSAAIK